MNFLLLILLSFNTYAEKLPSFSLPIYNKSEIFKYSKESKNLDKVMLINFWASWCTSCIQEIPELEALKKSYPDVDFFAVNAGDSKIKIKKFLKKTKFSYLVLMDKDKTFSKGLGVLSLPVTIIVAANGDIIYRNTKPPKSINVKR